MKQRIIFSKNDIKIVIFTLTEFIKNHENKNAWYDEVDKSKKMLVKLQEIKKPIAHKYFKLSSIQWNKNLQKDLL